MTILFTDITRFGIVFAADSLLTRKGKPDSRRRKILEVPYLQAVIGYFGLAQVRTKYMDDWLRKFINDNHDAVSLEEFAHRLGAQLDTDMPRTISDRRLGMHIAGYMTQDDVTIPSFWFVRNIQHLDTAGRYHGVSDKFQVSEEIRGHHYKHMSPSELSGWLEKGNIIFFRNGVLVPTTFVSDGLHNLFKKGIWRQPGFRPPQSLKEYAEYVEFRTKVIIDIFRRFHLSDVLVGGPPCLLAIRRPSREVSDQTASRILPTPPYTSGSIITDRLQ